MKIVVRVYQGDRTIRRTKVGRMQFIFKMVGHLVPRVDIICDLILALNAGRTITYDHKGYTVVATKSAEGLK